MIIGIPKEIKNKEFRVGLTPFNAHELISLGHKVIVEKDAGLGIGFMDEHYASVGVTIAASAQDVYGQADMIVKVKEPQPEEYVLLRKDQILFTYLHLAADLPQAEALMKAGCVAIAYETVTDKRNSLPLLTPMSQVAGRLSVQVGAQSLLKSNGGSGLLLGGVPGVAAAKVVVIGGGVVGTNAIRMAMGTEAHVTVLDVSHPRLEQLDFQFGGRLNTTYASRSNIEQYVKDADLVIGAVLIPGKAAPSLVPRSWLRDMRPGSVMVDVAIDQGGCFETSRPTSHSHPTYVIDDIVHYCVTNMPGAVPRTSTLALNNVTLPFIIKIANQGWRDAISSDPHLKNGVNVCQGAITHAGVAADLGLPHTALNDQGVLTAEPELSAAVCD
ncbi:MAG: alanine dehydrogenase [Coxiellaceae bacterium]|nr:alanine dehydrogenase [Coxiellaceae bacterium]